MPTDPARRVRQPRDNRGRWTGAGHAEAGQVNPSLTLHDARHVAHEPGVDARGAPQTEPPSGCAGTWAMVTSADLHDRCDAAFRTDLTVEQAVRLTRTWQPVAVRLAVGRSLVPGIAKRLANDPDPLVRHLALRTGWDLDEAAQRAVRRDPVVAAISSLLGTPAPDCDVTVSGEPATT